MQTFKINQLPPEQQAKLKPIIEEQKTYEKNKIKTYYYPFGAILGAIIYIWISVIKGNLYIYLIPFVMLLSAIIIGKIMYYCSPETVAAVDKDDFFILYGYINDKHKKSDRYYIGHEKYITDYYYYIIEGKSIEVADGLFKDFNYYNIPVGQNRYLLMRLCDEKIRKDVTEYF